MTIAAFIEPTRPAGQRPGSAWSRLRRWLRRTLAPWQRRAHVQHVYYALAAFDVVAVLAGLLLSHHLMTVLTSSVERTLDWRQLHEQLSLSRWHAQRINLTGNELLTSPDADGAAARLEQLLAHAERSATELQGIRIELVPPHAQGLVADAVAAADRACAELAARTRTVVEHARRGDMAGAVAAAAAMNRSFGWVLGEIDNVTRTMQSIEADEGHRRLEQASRLRRMEYFIGIMILLMVLNTALYGHRLGNAMSRQLERLTALRGRLAARVHERTARLEIANQSIASLNQDLERSVRELEGARDDLARRHDALQLHNTHLEATIDNTMRGLCLFDSQHRLVMANRRYFDIYGFSAGEVAAGMSVREILAVRARHGHLSEHSLEDYLADRMEIIANRSVSIRTLALPDDRIIEISIYPTSDGGWVSMHDDVTDEKLVQQRIVHLAHHDALTGLTNRLKFQDELEAALNRTERGGQFAVLSIDLDYFKQVNDTLGHPVGDKLLKAVAERLTHNVRKSDIVARIGGDEFAIIQATSEQPQGATALAARLIEELSKPYLVDDHQVVIGASVGIAITPGDGRQPDTLIKHADLALYRAKSEGRGTFRLFETEMDALMQERRRLELDLRQAIVLEQFELFYQPLIDAATLSINGFEALLRWRHPERGLIPPLSFIPLAEEMGLMGAIGAWVLKRGCLDAIGWPDQLRVAINVSPAQFRSRPLELDVMAALAASGLAPARLELEITESVLLENSAATIEMLTRLRSCGIKIAMDDFGTGYSSLSYLLSFPFDKIKLDRSFTRGLTTGSSAQSIVQAVVGLGRGLGMSTTAEGVETAEQLQRLRAEGCSEVQGFLFSKPVPIDAVPELMARLEPPRRAAG